MNQRQLASVLFGVGGVFLLITRIPETFVITGMWTQLEQPSADPAGAMGQHAVATAMLASTLLLVLLGIGLIAFRDRLAHRLFPTGAASLGTDEMQAVALSVLGCYFAVQGASRVYASGQMLWGGAIQLALGVGLFAGARALARIWSGESPGRGMDTK